MFKIFNQSYPLSTIRERFIHAFVISVFVYFFLSILEPFDLNLFQEANKEWFVLGYGLSVSVLLCIFYVFIPLAIPGIFNEKKWKVYKEIIWIAFILCIVGFSLTIYEALICAKTLNWKSIYETVGKTAIIGIFPLSGIVLLNYIRLLKKYLTEAKKINIFLNKDVEEVEESTSNIVTLNSDNKSESFQNNIQNILFIAAMGNYIEIYTENENKAKKTILRTTLNKTEKRLSEYSQMYRCHRAFIVNIQNIASIDGKANGYTLHFKNLSKTVPVSRRNSSNFKRMISSK